MEGDKGKSGVVAVELVSGVSFHANASSWKVVESSQVLSTGIVGSGELGGKTSGDRCEGTLMLLGWAFDGVKTNAVDQVI